MIYLVKIDLNLKRQVLEMILDGEKLATCFQCGMCNDVCPVSQRWGSRYNPRDLVLFSSLGYTEALVTAVKRDPFILWGCTGCDTCDEYCPAEIPITEIINLLKNAVVPMGITPEFFPSSSQTIMENGVAIPMMAAIEKRRDQLGLEKAPNAPKEEVEKLLKAVGLPEILEKAKGGSA